MIFRIAFLVFLASASGINVTIESTTDAWTADQVSALFQAPYRPPFRAGWPKPGRGLTNGQIQLCSSIPSYEASIVASPLPNIDISNQWNWINSPKRIIKATRKPNPDAIPICGAWKKWYSLEDSDYDDNGDSCYAKCAVQLAKCINTPQFWEWNEWRTNTLNFDGSSSNWNGVFDCVAEELIGKCYGPCRSASSLDKVTQCTIKRGLCASPLYRVEEVMIETTADDTTTTAFATTTENPTTTDSRTTLSDEDAKGGFWSNTVIGTTVISAGGAAAGIGACCHCAGGTQSIAASPGLKDFGNVVGGVRHSAQIIAKRSLPPGR
eukprot:Blabericola_migrator_1__3974@NODE_2201_length_3137_cov_57_500000_g1386_i0_p1_GENE_NODE_2201_length_3137_cov_57_500000_g1386_i0NODE_2201_length_3137_cov_57_500000_g1386_i0_p1_ORF_typecomplete_len323_score32_14Mid2/PF04478_12/0_074Alpha_GJ/PF03229_13/0_62_NODE_2201_length_3137_cov_57_500000_g1386_i02371205